MLPGLCASGMETHPCSKATENWYNLANCKVESDFLQNLQIMSFLIWLFRNLDVKLEYYHGSYTCRLKLFRTFEFFNLLTSLHVW